MKVLESLSLYYKNQTIRVWESLLLYTLLYHKYPYYKHLTFSNWLARGMPHACDWHTRHSSGNGYGDSPRHASHTRLSNKSHISVQYRLQLCYESCIGYSIRKHYTSHSGSHCANRYDNRSGNHCGICSLNSQTISITQVKTLYVRVNILYMQYYLHFYLKSNVGSIIGNYSYMAMIASYRLQRRMVAKGGDPKHGN